MMGTRPADTGPERNQSRSNQASRADVPPGHVVVDQATDLALLGVADVLAEIARESGAAQVQEQSLGGLRDDQ